MEEEGDGGSGGEEAHRVGYKGADVAGAEDVDSIGVRLPVLAPPSSS